MKSKTETVRYQGGHAAWLLAEIKAEAERISKEFMKDRQIGGMRFDRNDFSRLVLRVGGDGINNMSIDWLRRRWIGGGSGKKRRMVVARLRKGTGPKYKKYVLMKYAKEWEREAVWEAECRMAQLREGWKLAKQLQRWERKYLSGGVESGSEDEVDEATAIDDAVGFIPDYPQGRPRG